MSSYIEDTLMSGERVIYRCKPHWIIFAPTVGWLLVLLAAFIYGPSFDSSSVSLLAKLYQLFIYVALGATIVTGVLAYITNISSEFGVTNKRVLIKVGFIRRISLEIFLRKIESIYVQQSIPGRLFSYGTLVISGTGGIRDSFRNIPYPLKFRKQVQQQIDHIHQHGED